MSAINLITPGKNTAVFSREDLPKDAPAAEKANYWLERAGKAIEPPGCTYLGSAVVHYYEVKNLDDKARHTTATQLQGMLKVGEQFADWGYKELQKTLMRAFGREVN